MGFFSGRTVGLTARIVYLCTGVKQYSELSPSDRAWLKEPPLDFSEVSAEMTRLYADPLNLMIPVPDMFKVAVHAIAGSNQAQIDQELQQGRKSANQIRWQEHAK
ncbi:MAG TPA: hypothetical protein VFB14_25030 [Bryobacteraceae bacterium]|jgi:hypothetical protein|nr:hypothetical protein [Bryobacteraceae bacterium]